MSAHYDEPSEGLATSGPRLARYTEQSDYGSALRQHRPAVLHSRGRHAVRRSHTARRWLIATVSSVTAIGGLSLWIGPSAIIGPWDVFTLLNGAYRIYQGQSPSTNFANPIGPLVYGLAAIGMHLSFSLRAVTYSQVIFLAILSPLAWAVSSRRLPAAYAAGFTVFAAWLCISVRPLGYSYRSMTYAMLYNTDAWLLYASLLLLVLLPMRRPAAGAAAGDAAAEGKRTGGHGYLANGLVLGTLLGLLFYDKVTFFLAAIVAAGVGLALRTLPRSPRLGAAALAGFGVVGVLVRILFRLHTTAYIRDLIEAANVQASGQRGRMLAHAILWSSPVGLVALLVAALLLFNARRQREPMRPLVLLLLAATYVMTSSMVLSAGDATEKGDLPALVVIPLLAVAFLEPQLPRWAGGSAAARPQSWSARRYLLLIVGLAVLFAGTTAPIAGKNALALGEAISYRSYVANPPASQQFASGPLRDFVIPTNTNYQTAYRASRALPAMINNGLALLRQNVHPGQTVFTLAYTDPFYLAMHLPLGHCGPLWWDLNYDFDAADHVSAQCAIGDSTWVIVPRMVAGQGCCQETVSVMLHLYSGYLSRYYHRARQTADWTLFRRDAG